MRVTNAMLESKIEILNESMGRPCSSYTRNADGSLTANIGNFHLYHCLGVWAVHEMFNEGGGVSVLLSCSTKSELFDQLNALIRGLELGRMAC